MELNERKMRILKAIVDDYIASGMPIGSRTVSRMWGGTLSPATIRNEMSDLEEMGYLDQPHASAGRIPSDKAYRLYVNRFLQMPALSPLERDMITRQFDRRIAEIDQIMARMARVLSEVTDYVAMVMSPQIHHIAFRQIRLIPVSRGRALAVIVTDEGIVKDLMIAVAEDMDERHFDLLSNLLTERMRGRTREDLAKVLGQMRQEMNEQADVFASLMQALELSEGTQTRNVFFDGTQNLFKHPEYANPERAKHFLATMQTGELFYQMLNQAQDMEFSISIGKENAHEALQDSSVVTATYSVGGTPVGSFGVIGPTRMDYNRVLAIVELLSQSISNMFSND